MRRMPKLFPPLMIVLTLIVFFRYYPGPELVVTTEYLTLLPSLILIIIGVYGIKSSRGYNQVFACSLLGVGFAIMASELNTLNVLIPDILTPTFTLQYLQTLIIVFSTLIGVAMKD